MNKQNEIKSIKEAQRDLADRLEALEQETPKRKPECGDVWQRGGERYMVANAGSGGLVLAIDVNDGTRWSDTNKNPFGGSIEEFTYLGKAKDVLMLRSDVEKDYVSKEELCCHVREVDDGRLHAGNMIHVIRKLMR
jgi:hypothetical protein